jgi:hypothetical protein
LFMAHLLRKIQQGELVLNNAPLNRERFGVRANLY